MPSGLRLFRFQRKTMPWKSDLKASPQKVILGDGRRSKKHTDKTWAFTNKTNPSEGPKAEVLKSFGLSRNKGTKQQQFWAMNI